MKLDIQLLHNVTDALSLADFILALRGNLREHPDEWQNWTIEDYLESIEAWLRDYNPIGPEVDQSVPMPHDAWRMVGEVLLVGAIYE